MANKQQRSSIYQRCVRSEGAQDQLLRSQAVCYLPKSTNTVEQRCTDADADIASLVQQFVLAAELAHATRLSACVYIPRHVTGHVTK